MTRWGRVWRTNAGDGVMKVYLYDLTGAVSSEIRSTVIDLGSLGTASERLGSKARSASITRTTCWPVVTQTLPAQDTPSTGNWIPGNYLNFMLLETAWDNLFIGGQSIYCRYWFANAWHDVTVTRTR
jgi:hypothetical protein